MILKKQRLDQILVDRNLAETKSKAQAMIMAGQIYVEGNPINKSGFGIKTDAYIEVKNLGPEWVSRGAFKLIKAIETYKIEIKNKICLDIGSSTGGFTDVLINKNAQKVYAVDVGTNQLHEKLKKNSKVISLEKMNARYLNKELFTDLIEIMVCDVSFISLKKVIGPNLNLLTDKSIIIVLIKPQFEAKKYELKKGIIRDSQIHKRICDEIKEWFETECSCYIEGIIESPIKGPKGNTEFLLIAKYQKKRKQ
ncbi:MAG: TlyA family RNA methyltransferase [Pelagibacteraceae bacterium]|nr:TlyA family RNA methyltransferase [Pelagibacteraceae bacterium]MBT4952025.1 TlyA family RNA methyltransferase [Pelagibacteraceae bacterium]